MGGPVGPVGPVDSAAAALDGPSSEFFRTHLSSVTQVPLGVVPAGWTCPYFLLSCCQQVAFLLQTPHISQRKLLWASQIIRRGVKFGCLYLQIKQLRHEVV